MGYKDCFEQIDNLAKPIKGIIEGHHAQKKLTGNRVSSSVKSHFHIDSDNEDSSEDQDD